MITWVFVPLDLILPDQPNRAVRTRMLRGVGGGSCEAPPYPDNGLWSNLNRKGGYQQLIVLSTETWGSTHLTKPVFLSSS